MNKFISCVVPGPLQWFFHFGEEITIKWTQIGWVEWMLRNLPLPAVQEVSDSSGVAPCIVMKNDEVLFYQMMSCPPESMQLWSLPQTRRTTARDLIQHKRWTCPCYRAVNTEPQQRQMHWCCIMPLKHLTKTDKYGGGLYWRYINVVPLWIKTCQKFQTVAITFYPTLVHKLRNQILNLKILKGNNLTSRCLQQLDEFLFIRKILHL